MRLGCYVNWGDDMKYSESELKVLEVLWEYGEMDAKQISEILQDRCGWNKTTVYTFIRRCIEKGSVQREYPFKCRAILTKEEVQDMEIGKVLRNFFDNSPSAFMEAFAGRSDLTDQDIEELHEIILKLKSDRKK